MVFNYEHRSHIFGISIVAFLVAGIFLFLNQPLSAQNVQWINYTPGQEVSGVAQTESHAWVATSGGLARIDKSDGGHHLLTKANSGLSSNQLRAIEATDEGDLWIGTGNAGIISYDGSQWLHFHQSNSGLRTNWINDIAVGGSDTLWAAADDGVYLYDGSRWTQYGTPGYGTPENYYAVDADDDGTVWVGIAGDGLASFPANAPDQWTMWEQKSSNSLDFSNVMSVAVNSDGRVWVGSEFGEIGVWDGSAWTIYESDNSNLPNSAMMTLEFTGPDSVWAGTDGSGIALFDGSSWSVLSSSNSGLKDNRVLALSMDSESRRFVGTVDGLMEYSGGNWTGYTLVNSQLQQTSRTTEVAFDSQGNVWIGTGEDFASDGYGLVKYDGSSWTVFNTSNSDLPGNTVTSVVVGPDDRIWAGTVEGLAIYDGTTWEVFAGFDAPLPSEEILDLEVTSSGVGWIVTNSGIARKDGSDWTSFTTGNSSLPADDITSIAVDSNGTVWAGTRYEGVVKYDGSSWTFGNGDNRVLQSALVGDVAVDANGNVWVAKLYSSDIRGGVMKYDGENWTNFLARNSAFPWTAGGAYALTFDEAGNLWIGSDGAGLVQYDGQRMQVYRRSNSGISQEKVFGIAVNASGEKWITGNSAGVDVLKGDAAPLAGFSAANREGNAPLTVKFRGKVENMAESYQWQFPGGDPSSSQERNPTVTYSSSGTYEVTLSVTNAYGQDEKTKSGYVTVHEGDYKPATAWQVYNNGDIVHELVEEGDSLWIATNGGLVLMNRETHEKTLYNTSNSPLEANGVLDIGMDSNGTKWLATDGGGLMSLKNGNWSQYTAEDGDFSYNIVTQLAIDTEDNVWFSTFQSGGFGGGQNEGIIKYDGSSFQVFSRYAGGDQLPAGQINVLEFDGSGDLWIGMKNEGLVKFDGSEYSAFKAADTGLPGDRIESILPVGDEEIWVGCAGIGAGLGHYDGSDWETYTESNSEIHDDWVQTIVKDAGGNIWFGTQAFGMAEFNGSTFSFYDQDNSNILSDNVNHLHIDSEGTFWIGTKLLSSLGDYSGQPGLATWDGHRYQWFDLSNSGLPSNATASVFQDSRGDIWIGAQSSIGLFGEPHRGGLVRYDGQEWELFLKDSSGLPLSTVEVIREDQQGNLWMANPANDDIGAVRFDGGVWTTFHTENSEMPVNTVNDYAVDGSGKWWIATAGGLVEFTDSVETTFTTGNSDIPGDEVTAVSADGNGTLWIGTAQNGVAAYQHQSDSWTTYDDTEHSSLVNGIGRIAVKSSSEIYLVISGWTGSELIKYDGSGWESIETGTGWSTINDLEFDAQGNLWLALGGGLTEFSGGIAKYNGSAWTTFSSENSEYPGGAVLSLEATAAGDFWLATSEGAVRFRGEDAVTSINTPENPERPERYLLSQNYPNPFNPVTTIDYSLPENARVQLEVYNLLGQQVNVLVDKYQQAGRYTVRWNASDLSSGVYFYRIKTPGFTEVRKMTLLK